MVTTSRPRLAELVASLTLATDLGLGVPQEHVLRQTVIAQRLAALAGLTDGQRAAVPYVSCSHGSGASPTPTSWPPGTATTPGSGPTPMTWTRPDFP